MLYYVAGRSTMNRAQAVELGLGYAAGPGSCSSVATSSGPDGQAGVVFSFGGTRVHRADAATWEEHYALEGVWVGFDPASPPAPEDLEREAVIKGHAVTLGDGRQWIVPVARKISGDSGLPCRLRMTRDGWVVGDVSDAQHRALFDRACEIWDMLRDGSVTLEDECDLAAIALGMNYRVCAAEISTLGLFTTQAEAEVVEAILDLPSVPALKKKLARAPLS